MSDDITLHDQLAIESDRRKLEKLVNDGVISREELARAPIVEVESPTYEFDNDHSLKKNCWCTMRHVLI